MHEGQERTRGLSHLFQWIAAAITGALPEHIAHPERRKDIFIAAGCEAALILVVSFAAWVSRAPLIFASLGPTAFALVAAPRRRTAHAYNIVVGHTIGIVAGFISLYVTGAIHTSIVSSAQIPLERIWAAALSATLTVAGILLARARQPAALATTLLISLGLMQTWRDGVTMLCAVLLMTLIGEPLRHWRERSLSGY
jgi:hypothetical protein